MCEYQKDEICHTEDMRKLFIGNIHLETTDDELKAFMEENSGDTVEHCVIIRPKDKTPKYYMGFCTFSDSDTPDELFLKRDALEIRGVKLVIKRAVPKNDYTPGAHEKVKKLFIANLPKDGNAFKVEDLQKHFEERHNPRYGTIEKIQLIKEKGEDGGLIEEKNRGFGFIFVSSEDFADKLCIQHRNFEFMGRKIDMKKNVSSGEGGDKFGGGRGGGRGRGRGRGGPRGGHQQPPHHHHGGWGGDQGGWGADQGWGAGYEYDQSYDSYYGGGGGYGGGYAAGGYGGGQQQRGGRGGGRGRGRGAGW